MGLGRLDLLTQPACDLQCQPAKSIVIRVLGERGPQKLQAFREAPGLNIGERVLQGLRLDLGLGGLSLAHQRVDLLQTTLQRAIVGPHLQQHGQRLMCRPKVAPAELFKSLLLQGLLMIHVGPGLLALHPEHKAAAPALSDPGP